MSNKPKRKGVWVEVKTFTDPNSNIGVVISERIRGKAEYSMQFIHFDEMGPNRYITCPCPGAKHSIRDIMFSLADQAEKFIAGRRQAEGQSSSVSASGG